MKRERRSIGTTLVRCVSLSCPACGRASIVQSLFRIKHHCSSCDALFRREDGFFVGALLANMIITELVIVLVYLVYLLTVSGRYQLMIIILFAVALLFPVAFYHHSWSFWLGFDYLIESLPKHVQKGADTK